MFKNVMGNDHSTRAAALAFAVAATIGAASSRAAELDEVIVTAQKRAESLQDVSASVLAFDETFIEKAAIASIQDLQLYSPGLLVGGVSNSRGSTSIYIRGIGTFRDEVGFDPSVAVYIDGSYLGRTTSLLNGFLDLERIEVLRGPQGTLYGRNATGGALNYISAKPTEKFYSKVSIDLATYETNSGIGDTRITGVVSGPLADSLSGRIAIMRQSADAPYKRIVPDTSTLPATAIGTDDVRTADLWALRGSLRWKASDRVEVKLAGDYLDDNAHQNALVHLSPGGQMQDANVLAIFGPALASFPIIPTPSLYRVASELDGKSLYKEYGGNLTVDAKFDNFSLRSITSYRDISIDRLMDPDGSELDVFINHNLEDSDWWSQEVQLLSPDDARLEWMLGAFYYEQDSANFITTEAPFAERFTETILGLPPGTFAGAFTSTVDATNKVKSRAGFINLGWNITDEFKLLAGIRYTKEEKTHFLEIRGGGLGFPGPTGTKKWSATTPKFGVEYRPNDDVMLFATASRGFKSGGFNSLSVQPNEPPVSPEFVWNYEGGIRTSWLDGRLTANATVYYYEAKDLQVFQQDINLGLIVENAAKASGKGLEVEVNWAATDALSFALALGYLDAEYDEFISNDPVTSQPVDLAGGTPPYAPKLQSSLIADWVLWKSDRASISARATWQHQSSMQFTTVRRPLMVEDSRDLFGVALYGELDGHWRASLAVDNITNKKYRELATDAPASTLGNYFDFPGQPRTFRLGMIYEF